MNIDMTREEAEAYLALIYAEADSEHEGEELSLVDAVHHDRMVRSLMGEPADIAAILRAEKETDGGARPPARVQLAAVTNPDHPGRAPQVVCCETCGKHYRPWRGSAERFCTPRCAGIMRRVVAHVGGDDE